MKQTELRKRTSEFVTSALTKAVGRSPSKTSIKTTVDKILKAMAEVSPAEKTVRSRST